MAVVVTIGGATKSIKARTLTISQTANGRATASFVVDSVDGSYRPALDAEVIITEGATRIFGGLVDRPRERGLVEGAKPAISTALSCTDFHAYTERRLVSETIPVGSLEAALTILVDYLSDDYGVTLDAGQVTGPTLPELVYDYRPLTDVLNELAKITAQFGEPYVWRIDAFKVLSMYQPSAEPAPFDLVGNVLPEVLKGDIEVEVERAANYANRIIVKVPTKTEFGHTEVFTGDGVTSSFPVQYDVMKHYGHILVASGGGELLGTPEGGGGGQWSYDATTKTLTRSIGATVNGETYTFYFDGSYSGLGIAEDAGEIASVGLWERLVSVENVPSDATAQSIADAELAIALPVKKTVKYSTLETGIEPGQSQTINVSRRNVNLTAVITDVVIKEFTPTQLVRMVTATVDDAQTNLGRGWRDVYKQWSGDKSGSAVAAVAAATGTQTAAGPGLPFNAVQFNRTGVFGGDADFTYAEDTNCLVMGGGGSSITAAEAESCAVFGYNCHITDP